MGRDIERGQYASHVCGVKQCIEIRDGASLEDARDDRRMRRVDGRIRLHVPEEVRKVSVAWHGAGGPVLQHTRSCAKTTTTALIGPGLIDLH
jgi:hypothetical protein